MNPKKVKKLAAEIAEQFAGHQIKPRKSISWTLNKVDAEGRYLSNYAYSVTWTPGSLVIAGDLGEFTVTHWNAMKTIENAVSWLTGIQFDYLMGKSDAKQTLDIEETMRDILRYASEEAVWQTKQHVKELRDWRREVLEDAEVAARDGVEPDPPARPGFLKCDTNKGNFRVRFRDSHPDWIAPDGWDVWLRLYEHYKFDVDDEGLGPDCIFKSKYRRQIKEALGSALSEIDGEPQHFVADLCYKLGLDDYHGTYNYDSKYVVFFVAIQRWLELVGDQYVPKPAAGEMQAVVE